MAHLFLADNIIVLGADGRIAEQGTFEQLRSRGGFVSKLLLNPELLKSRTAETGANDKTNQKTKTAAVIPKAPHGATPNDVEDLTRRVGDLSVYKYYARSIGWKIASVNITCSLIASICQTFPCKYFSATREKYTNSLALWSTLYADGNVTSLPLFSVIYVLAGVLALAGIFGVMWFVAPTLPRFT